MQAGINQTELKKLNLTLVLKLIYQEPGISRSSLATKTGLTFAAISKLVDELLSEELIVESDPILKKRGRPATGLTFCARNHQVLAIKLSRRYIRWGVFDFDGNSIEVNENPLNQIETSQDLMNILTEGIEYYLHKDSKIRSIGFAIPGPFDKHSKKIAVITEMNKLEGIDLKPVSQKEFGVPIFFIHDANAGAMSEWLVKGSNSNANTTIAYYLIGEGVGVGVVKNGHVFDGDSGMAGELGHVSIDPHGEKCRCGNYGCLEMYTSSIAIERRAEFERIRFPNSLLNHYKAIRLRDVFESALENDFLANKLLSDATRWIAFGAVNIINAYDPSLIILGDEFAKGAEPFLDEMNKIINERTSYRKDHVKIEIEDNSYDHILHGAASVAIHETLNNPDLLIGK